MWVQSLGWEDPLEEGMATQSSILAWRIPWTEETGSVQSQGRKESDMTEVTLHSYTHVHIYQSFAVQLKVTQHFRSTVFR